MVELIKKRESYMTNTIFSTSINFVNLDEDGILVCDNAIVSLGNIRGTTRAESEAAAISTFEVLGLSADQLMSIETTELEV